MLYKSTIVVALASGAHAWPQIIGRGGVTALIAPSPAAPKDYKSSYSGSFGIAVMNATSAAACPSGKPQATSAADPVQASPVSGQPQAATTAAAVAPVSQIGDGQIQGATGVMTAGMISMINDGQIQAPISHATMTVAPVSEISDGQPQAPMSTVAPVSEISDGQPQAPKSAAAPKSTAAPVSEIGDGQPQVPKSSATAVSEISDGQPQATNATSAVSQINDGQPQATSTSAKETCDQPENPMMQLVACAEEDTLSITLDNGVLHDNKGRQGYIASNYQFQFDQPPQAGAIYTSGFTVAKNGSLALGNSTVFYQCMSGNFYNLYNENWAPQCEPVEIQTLQLQTCSK